MSDSLGIELENVSLNLPVYGGGNRSLRGELVQKLIPGRKSRFAERSVSVLKEISISLGEGERIGLRGRNGAGKSTLLRLLAGIYWPTEGRVHVAGEVRCLFGLNPGMQADGNGYENIRILSRLLRYPKSEIKDIIEEVAEFSELGSAMDRPVRTYSDGMRLRLCFGVITARPADILLIDEVIGVGDKDFKEKAIERMKELIFRSGILVMASHDSEIMNSFCTESLRMENGRVAERIPIEGEDSEGADEPKALETKTETPLDEVTRTSEETDVMSQ